MRADRLLAILLTLQARGKTTARALAGRLEVSERTIYRDIDALSAAGVPIYAERGPGGGVALLEGYQTRLTGLNENEVQALSMLGAQGTLGDLGLSRALESALLKLSAALPGIYRHSMEHVRARVHLDASRWFAPKEAVPHLQTLQEGLYQDRRLELLYRSDAGRSRRRRLEPYGLVAKAGVWYLVAHGPRGWRVYRVSRVQGVTLLDETFTRDGSFELAHFWQDWCGTFEASRSRFEVTLRVSPRGAEALTQALGEWVRGALAQAPADGQGQLRLPLVFDNEMQAIGTLLGFGDLIEVLEPPALRARLVEAAREVLRTYAPAEGPTVGNADTAEAR